MDFELKELETNCASDLAGFETESLDVIILNTFFDIGSKSQPLASADYSLTTESKNLVAESCRLLKKGGFLFVYGLPQELPLIGEFLDDVNDKDSRIIFKYWIALDIDNPPASETLRSSHLGLLMYLKTKHNSPTPFHLNTKEIKISHNFCAACGENVKDWGGKKHLMNPKGIAVSDVWRDFKRIRITNHFIPNAVESRIIDLTKRDGAKFLKIKQKKSFLQTNQIICEIPLPKSKPELSTLEFDKPYEADCISFLNSVSQIYPDGVFDMVFADPPYNLGKNYNVYGDSLVEKKYIEWCNQWLLGMAKTLKPGGTLFVLNLPKWCIHHATFLHKHLEFRNWIVWDALSDPRGKIMPAHYGLLYYTKPGAQPIFNYSGTEAKQGIDNVAAPDSPKYCLRNQCVKERKRKNDDEKVELSDIWFDIHRIKHKRDRDAHPCQLPEKLMERLILLSTNPGGVVFDPFSGAGTTAIASAKLGRHFVVTDLDSKYVQITEEKIKTMRSHADLFGNYSVPRVTVKRDKQPASKKEVELYLQNLAHKLERMPTAQDIDPIFLQKIESIYPTRGAAFKRSKVALHA